MSERGDALAKQFEDAHADVLAAVESLSDPQWRATCADEGWSVGVTTHHIAVDCAVITDSIRLLADGLPLAKVTIADGRSLATLTMAEVDQLNEEHAQTYANCTKEETVALLRRNADEAARMLRGLSDAQFERADVIHLLGGQSWTVQQLVEGLLIGHFSVHLPSIVAATAASS